MGNKHARILLTGSTGFVGSALQQRILADGQYDLTVSVRCAVDVPANVRAVQVTDLTATTDWSDALQNIDVVIHSAARVHVMNDTSADPLAEFRKVNVDGTLALAKQAVAAGVKRFIFISSVKVSGEETLNGQALHPDDEAKPQDPYGISKHEAEQELLLLASKEKLEVVIIRPTLVYGPGVKANFESMMKWVQRNLPLPLGAINNKRSLVSVYNLVDLILTCVEHPAAVNQSFFASDGQDLSTTEMIHLLSSSFEKRILLIPIPMMVLKILFSLIGKKNIYIRLCGSLQVDIGKNKRLLQWTPPVTVESAFLKTVEAYKLKK